MLWGSWRRYVLCFVSFLRKVASCQAMVAQAFNPKTQQAEASNLCDFKASLVYRVSSRRVRTVQHGQISHTEKLCPPKQKQNKKKRGDKKHPVSCTLPGSKWKEMEEFYEASRNYYTMGKIQEEASQTSLHKGTQGISRTFLRAQLALGLKIIAPYAGKN